MKVRYTGALGGWGPFGEFEAKTLEIDGVPYVPPPAPKPQKWEVDVALCVGESSRPCAVVHRVRSGELILGERARIILEFGEGWARVKPTVRDRELAKMLRDWFTRWPGMTTEELHREIADRLDGGDK